MLDKITYLKELEELTSRFEQLSTLGLFSKASQVLDAIDVLDDEYNNQ